MIANRKINFTKTKAIGDGIYIPPATTEDHRKLTVLTDEVGTQYHTYLLAEEKPLSTRSTGNLRKEKLPKRPATAVDVC